MSKSEQMSCCPPTRCAVTPPGEYTKKGEFHSIANPNNGKDLRYYKVDAESSRNAIILINDIFGLDSGRHFGVADSLSQGANCTVIMPDFFRGDNCKFEWLGTPTFLEMVNRHPIDAVRKDLDFLYSAILPKSDFDTITFVGFCWGSWVGVKEGNRLPDSRLNGVVLFHPALKLEGIFNGSVEQIIKECKLPMFVMPCKDDEENLKLNSEKCLVRNQLVSHKFEVNHGYCTQGDLNDEVVKRNVETSIKETNDFVRLINSFSH